MDYGILDADPESFNSRGWMIAALFILPQIKALSFNFSPK